MQVKKKKITVNHLIVHLWLSWESMCAENNPRDVHNSSFIWGLLFCGTLGLWCSGWNIKECWVLLFAWLGIRSFFCFPPLFLPRLSWVLLYVSLIFVMSILMAVIATASSLFPQSSAFVIFLLFFLYGVSSVSVPGPVQFSHPMGVLWLYSLPT